MIQRTRQFLVLVVLVLVAAPSALGQTPDPLEAVCDLSRNLTAYSATIRMTQHHGNDHSVIEFTFDFVPPDRMRIEYTAPASVDGQRILLNADQFYSYIPSLRRHVWQTVGDGASNPGEDMGFLFDFVTRAAFEAFAEADVQISETREAFELPNVEEPLEVDVLTLLSETGRQIIRLNAQDAAPIEISIYGGDNLAMEILVLDYLLNGAFEEAWFAIPEK